MIKRYADRTPGRVEGFKGGAGHLMMLPIIDSPEELWGKGRVFSQNSLEKNCEIGWHVHQGDGEIYCILSGEGEYNDNGVTVTVHPGDVTFTNSGEGHSLKNLGDTPLQVLALVLYC